MAKIIDNYILLELIGQGTFGEIHKGRFGGNRNIP